MRDDSFNAVASVEEAPVSALPQAPTEDKDLGIVLPDKPAVQVETNDKTVTHVICHQDVLMPGARYDTAVAENDVLYCPTCRDNFPVDQFSVDRRSH